MAVIFSDNFNALSVDQPITDSASWAHPTWATAVPIGSADGRIRSTGAAKCGARVASAMTTADYEISVVVHIRSLSNSTGVGVMARMLENSETGYRLLLTRSGSSSATLALARVAAGTVTSLATSATLSGLSSGTSVKIRLKVTGESIQGYLNDDTTPTIEATNSVITDAGYAGIVFTSNAGATTFFHADDYSIDDLISGGGGPVSTTVSVTDSGDVVSVTGAVGDPSVSTTLALTDDGDTAAITGAVPTGGSVRLQFGVDNERGGTYSSATGIEYWVYASDRETVISHGTGLALDGVGVGYVDLVGSEYEIGDNVLVALLKETSEVSVLDRTLRSGIFYVPAIAVP